MIDSTKAWKKIIAAMFGEKTLICDVFVGNGVDVHDQLVDMKNDRAGAFLVIVAGHHNQRRPDRLNLGHSEIERPDDDTVIFRGALAKQLNTFIEFADNGLCLKSHTCVLA